MTTHQPQVGDVITTVEELDALPSQAAVGNAYDGVFDVAQRATDPEWDGGRAWYVAGSRERVKPGQLLPAVILYLPDHPPRHERVVKAEALREAATKWQTGAWAENMPHGASRPALILGMAQHATEWLRARADEIEAGEPR